MKSKAVCIFFVSCFLLGLTAFCYAGGSVLLSTDKKLTAGDGEAQDKFGQAVAISGNYAVFGAPGEDSLSDSAGAAYIARFDGVNWVEMQKLTASDRGGLDKFGQSVAIAGDYVIVGAQGDNDNGESSGSAYIYHFDGTNWAEMQKLTASDGTSWDKFGQSVAISGSFAIVGASGDNYIAESTGSVYVFSFDGISWSEIQKLVPGGGIAWGQFGQSVSLLGTSALIGAPADDGNTGGSGSAYVFYYNGSNWVEEQKLVANDGAGWDKFGQSVSLSGNSAIIGAPGDDDHGDSSGSVSVFYFNGSSWVLEQKLTAGDGVASDYFGQSVSITGNYALIGACGDNDNGVSAGSAYVFYYDGNSWSQNEKLKSGDGAASDYFGQSVAVSATDMLIGASGDDDRGETSGSIFFYGGFTAPPSNNAPTANDLAISTTKNVVVAGNLSGSDPDSDPLEFLLATGAANGLAVVYADSSFTYTPNSDYAGGDSFTFIINDGSADSLPATVTVTIDQSPGTPGDDDGDRDIDGLDIIKFAQQLSAGTNSATIDILAAGFGL